MDIPSFLRLYPPFDDLEDDRLAEVVRHTHIEFFPVGSTVLQQSGDPSRYLYVIRTGAMELIDEGQVLDLLLDGEAFGFPSMLSGLGPTFTVRAHEDSICYLIDRGEAESILTTHSGLAFLSSRLRRRIDRALEGIEPESTDAWTTPVVSLVRRPPVTCSPSISVREAARFMTQEHVSSLLMEGDGGWAIVTDRDFRTKLLAEGGSAEEPVGDMATLPLISVDGTTTAAEVISLMLHRGIHHVPVLDEAGAIVGMVTDTDLMGLEQKTPFVLKADIERATTAEQVVEVGRRLPQAVCTLVDANVDPIDVGHVVGVTIDALTRRFLELGIAEQGDPPCTWAWLALGSEARLEQALVTDQDNAMVVDPGDLPMAAVDPYFQRLSSFVNDHVEEVGIPKCNAGVIASNPAWRHTPLEWEVQFQRWVEQGTWVGGALSAIAFDYRPVAGPFDVDALFGGIIRKASKDERFVRRLGTTALEDRPPTGFARDLVIHAKGRTEDKLDVKHGGITLITNLARVYGVMEGLTENRTLRRLRLAGERGRLDPDTTRGLGEAFQVLWQTRLEHQVRQVRGDEPPDDLVDPGSLGPLGRQGLKDAFRMIDRAQDLLANRLGVGR